MKLTKGERIETASIACALGAVGILVYTSLALKPGIGCVSIALAFLALGFRFRASAQLKKEDSMKLTSQLDTFSGPSGGLR